MLFTFSSSVQDPGQTGFSFLFFATPALHILYNLTDDCHVHWRNGTNLLVGAGHLGVCCAGTTRRVESDNETMSFQRTRLQYAHCETAASVRFEQRELVPSLGGVRTKTCARMFGLSEVRTVPTTRTQLVHLVAKLYQRWSPPIFESLAAQTESAIYDRLPSARSPLYPKYIIKRRRFLEWLWKAASFPDCRPHRPVS